MKLVLGKFHKHHYPVIQRFHRLHWTEVMKRKRLGVGEFHKHHSSPVLFSQAVLVVVRVPHNHRMVAQWKLMTYVVS